MKKILYHTLIKVSIGYLILLIVYLVSDFYLAQNVITLLGAIYISLAWIKYLLKDNFLKKNESGNADELLERNESRNQAIKSYLLSSVFLLIMALF